jgi:hypothetical protein
MTDHVLDIADPVTAWQRRQEQRAQRRAEGKAEQVRAEGRGEATGNPLGLSYDELGLIFSDWGFAQAFDKTIGRALDDMRGKTLLEMDEALAERDRQIADGKAELAELKQLVGGLLTRISQSDRSMEKEDQRRTAAIDKLEARSNEVQDLVNEQLSKLQAEIASLRGQIEGINTRERGPQGPQGERGVQGRRGPKGDRGDSGLSPRVPTLRTWFIEREKFRATPVMSDGSHGPAIELRSLFEEYNKATA